VYHNDRENNIIMACVIFVYGLEFWNKGSNLWSSLRLRSKILQHTAVLPVVLVADAVAYDFLGL
jgi:hypothetical protein